MLDTSSGACQMLVRPPSNLALNSLVPNYVEAIVFCSGWKSSTPFYLSCLPSFPSFFLLTKLLSSLFFD